jgi:hypothetical protein
VRDARIGEVMGGDKLLPYAISRPGVHQEQQGNFSKKMQVLDLGQGGGFGYPVNSISITRKTTGSI